MPSLDYTLDLDRSRDQTMREQARQAIIGSIRATRAGFCIGDRLSTLQIARQNAIHRNTLTHVMDDLVRLGFLRRLPNKGFEVVHPAPQRPPQLTQHVLSVTEVAERGHLESRSQVIAGETGIRRARELTGSLARVRKDLELAAGDAVAVLARCRSMREQGSDAWETVAIEQSFIPAGRVPGFLDAALAQIERENDFSVYRQLCRTFPAEEFFKAHYEISLAPLPETLAACWSSSGQRMCVVTVTYSSQGPIELTRTWFDASRAVLLAGSLDVKLT